MIEYKKNVVSSVLLENSRYLDFSKLDFIKGLKPKFYNAQQILNNKKRNTHQMPQQLQQHLPSKLAILPFEVLWTQVCRIQGLDQDHCQPNLLEMMLKKNLEKINHELFLPMSTLRIFTVNSINMKISRQTRDTKVKVLWTISINGSPFKKERFVQQFRAHFA